MRRFELASDARYVRRQRPEYCGAGRGEGSGRGWIALLAPRRYALGLGTSSSGYEASNKVNAVPCNATAATKESQHLSNGYSANLTRLIQLGGQCSMAVQRRLSACCEWMSVRVNMSGSAL